MTRRPNLVYVFADQLRTQSCGYYGGYADDPPPYTPNLDRLQQESLDFRNAVSVSPICCPYRNSLFTGKHQSSTGMVINELRAMPDPDAIGHVLSGAGYSTSYIGKWHLYGKHHGLREQFVPPGPYRLGFDQEWAAYNFNHQYYEGFYFEDTFEKQEVEGYEPHTQTDMAIDYMRRQAGSEDPFALFLSWGPPHDPWGFDNSPERFNDHFRDREFPDPPNYADGHARYWHPEWDEAWWRENWKPDRFQARRGYAAQTASIDWDLQRLLEAMEELGLAEDTIFVFTSDHGEMFGSQGRIAKKVFYEEAARVPFLLRYPGVVEPRVSEAAFNTVDIAPTLLGLMDLEVPASMEGMDASAAARGEAGAAEPEVAFMQGMGHTFQWHDGDEWRAVRDRQFTYARFLDGREYLFDNVEDPYQTRNLVGDPGYRAPRERLKDYMAGKMEELNDEFHPTTWYRQWVEDRVIVRSATRELEPEYRPEHVEVAIDA